jgi:hypothetical protein
MEDLILSSYFKDEAKGILERSDNLANITWLIGGRARIENSLYFNSKIPKTINISLH